MAESFRLRFSYVKRGRLALLSHLEVSRAIERGIRRAGLPFAVSQGFSPHLRVAFGAALPVGVGSTCELADVFLTEYVKLAVAEEALIGAFPSDLGVQRAWYEEPGAPAVSVAFPVSVYEVALGRPAVTWQVPETIEIARKKKTKTLTVADYLVEPLERVSATEQGDESVYRFALEAKPTGSLRPDAFVSASLGLGDRGLWSPESPVLRLTRIAQHH